MSVATLRKEAKELGIPFSELRGLTSEDEIQEVIDSHKRPTAVAKKKKGAVAKKKNSSRTQDRKSSARKSSPARSAKKSGMAKRATAAKKTTAKKSATAKRGRSKASEGGRNLLGDVDFSVTDGWNPREGSAPDRIVKALKRFKGNRAKVFDHLKGDLWDFVGRKNSKGEKRNKGEAEWQLQYRISRTAWDFAKRTGQHEPSQNRAAYGEGGTGVGVSGGMPVEFRPDGWGKPVFGKKKTKATRKATTARRTVKKTTAKRSTGRKGGAKRKATARGRK